MIADDVLDVRGHRRPQRAADAPAFLGVVAQDPNAEGDLLPAVDERLALLAGQQRGDVVDARLDPVGRVVDDLGACIRVRVGPGSACPFRRGHGQVDVAGTGERRAPERGTVGGIADFEPFTAGGGNEFSVDEQSAFEHGRLP